MKYYLQLFCLYTALLFSCSSDKKHRNNLLKSTDKVRLEKFRERDTLIYEVTNKTGIEVFTKIVDGQKEILNSSKRLGRAVYYSGGKISFNIIITDQGFEYTFKNKLYKRKLSYQAGMYFSEVWNLIRVHNK